MIKTKANSQFLLTEKAKLKRIDFLSILTLNKEESSSEMLFEIWAAGSSANGDDKGLLESLDPELVTGDGKGEEEEEDVFFGVFWPSLHVLDL